MPRKTSSDPDYNGGGPGLGGMTPPSHWSGHSPPSGGQTSAQQAVAGHIAAASHPSISSAQRSKMKAGLAIKNRDAAQVVRDAGGSPDTGAKTRDGIPTEPWQQVQLNTAQQKQQRRMQKLLARNRRGLAVGEAGLLANRAAGRRMSSMGGIRARQVNALEAEHGGLLQSTWGPKTRREARKILSAESAARPSKQAGGGQHQNVLAWLASIGVLSPTPNSKIKRQNKINAALQRRDGAVAMRALGQSPAPSIKTGDDIRALIRRGALRRDAGADALRAAKHNARGLRAKKVGDDARARRMAAGKPADIMDLSQNARVQEVNALEAEHARGTTWGSETRRMAREKVSDQSNADRLAQIGRARMQTSGARRRSAARARNFAARGAPVAGGRGAPVAGRRRGSDPDSQFGNDRPGSSRV